MSIHTWYDPEADVYVGKDFDSGIMSQGEGHLDAWMATQEAVNMHNRVKESLQRESA